MIHMSIVVTGASGHLGGLAIRYLLERQVPANQIIAVVRQPEKASALAELGVQVRQGDFNDRASLEAAFAGAEKLLFVPSPDAHDETLRLLQHANVAKAAKDAHIQQIAYYGYAFAEQSALPLAQTHLITEGILRSTGIPYTFLRNSLYTEMRATAKSIPPAARISLKPALLC
jgi:NAD(P)H dehydrogenase (quinone)